MLPHRLQIAHCLPVLPVHGLDGEQKGLVPTLTELLQDLSNEAFVLRSARTLIGRVSGHDATNNVPSVFGGTGGYDGSNMMNVA